ncbi:hypothetical protein EG14_10450 [Porphyromonas gingivalis]|nr:hypothetical protein EG14_10450 [Porphyromonas gingivalis]
MQAQQQPFDPSFTAPDRRPGRIPTFRRAERERGENRVYARELFHPTPLKTWREIFFVLARERPLQNKEMEGRGVLGIKGASERGGSKE